MNRALLFITTFSILFISAIAQSQSFSAKVVDEKTGDPISYATVQTGKHSGVITNEEGEFTLKESQVAKLKDSIFISSMGFETKGFLIENMTEGLITLTSKPFELKSVFLSTNNYSAEEIIALVKENIDANYAVNLSKNKIFFRQSDLNKMKKVGIEFVKSTIEELDKNLIDSIAGLIPRKSEYYREAVGDFYGDYSNHKLFVDKGAELYDKNADVSMDGLSEKMEKIFKDNVKPNSYLKIKSGWFGTKVQLDSLLIAEKDEDAKVKVENTDDQIFQEKVKDHISWMYEELFFHEDSKLDMLTKSNRYEFTLDNYTFIDEESVYIIRFEPKGRKDFEGVMYVNTEDFAIMRVEFNNVRPLKKFGLLGISYRHNLFRGKMLFNKNGKGTYSPKYIELESGSVFGVDRPLSVIEKNKFVKGRRKQNELALELDIKTTSINKFELVIYDSEEISQGAYDSALENPKMKADYLSQYDPSFWAGYNIMEPNAAIQEFKVLEE
jgi:hypothetical protein